VSIPLPTQGATTAATFYHFDAINAIFNQHDAIVPVPRWGATTIWRETHRTQCALLLTLQLANTYKACHQSRDDYEKRE
jgi:hypothetical protein